MKKYYKPSPAEEAQWALDAQKLDEGHSPSEKERELSRVAAKLCDVEAWVGLHKRCARRKDKTGKWCALMCSIDALIEAESRMRKYAVVAQPLSPRDKKAIKAIAKAIAIARGVVYHGRTGRLDTLYKLRVKACTLSGCE